MVIRAALFALHRGDDDSWPIKWEQSVSVEHYSTGSWDRIWDVEATEEALMEIAAQFLISACRRQVSYVGSEQQAFWGICAPSL
jgi:hypothetical protein